MSAAAGASQPPNRPPGGGGPSKQPNDSSNPPGWPNDKEHNGHNDWIKNAKIKTCKCFICGERVKKYSWECSRCRRRICSECSEKDSGSSRADYKHKAANHLDKKCNCAYASGQAPELHNELKELNLLMHPPHRDAEMQRDSAIKQKVMRERAERLKNEADSTPSKTPAGKVSTGSTGAHSTTSDADATYRGSATVESTIASIKPDRSKAKRPIYVDPDSPTPYDADTERSYKHMKKNHTSDDENASEKHSHPAPVSPTEQLHPCEHLDGGATVIVGAGVMGMFIAYELATKALNSGTKHSITVVEIRDAPCELASGCCAGVLSIDAMDEQLEPLADLAMESWSQLLLKTDLREMADFHQDDVFAVALLKGQGRAKKPSWYLGEPKEAFIPDEQSMGKLDTKKLSFWLAHECRKLGVQFFFNHEVNPKAISTHTNGFALDLINHKDINETTRKSLNCQNIILAAGPWTTQILNDMRGKGSLRLQNHMQPARWIQARHKRKSPTDDAGLLLPELAKGNATLEAKVTMVYHPNKRRVKITGVDPRARDAYLGTEDALDPASNSEDCDRALRQLAAKSLKAETEDIITPEKTPGGFAWVGTSNNKLPIIDKVPASMLAKISADARRKDRCAVWMCFGFGMYGTTLAPGAARALCRRMFGEKSGIDDEPLAIPKHSPRSGSR